MSEKYDFVVKRDFRLTPCTDARLGGVYHLHTRTSKVIARVTHRFGDRWKLKVEPDKTQIGWRRFWMKISFVFQHDRRQMGCHISCDMHPPKIPVTKNINLNVYLKRQKITLVAIPQTETTSGVNLRVEGVMGLPHNCYSIRKASATICLGPPLPAIPLSEANAKCITYRSTESKNGWQDSNEDDTEDYSEDEWVSTSDDEKDVKN